MVAMLSQRMEDLSLRAYVRASYLKILLCCLLTYAKRCSMPVRVVRASRLFITHLKTTISLICDHVVTLLKVIITQLYSLLSRSLQSRFLFNPSVKEACKSQVKWVASDFCGKQMIQVMSTAMDERRGLITYMTRIAAG